MRIAHYSVHRLLVVSAMAAGLAGCASSSPQSAPLVEAGVASGSSVDAADAPRTAASVDNEPVAFVQPESPTSAFPHTEVVRLDDRPAASTTDNAAVLSDSKTATAESAVFYGSPVRRTGGASHLPTVLSGDEVINWARAGARDDIIIDRIERSDFVFQMTAGEEIRLRQQGVSDDVIYAMKESSRR